MHESEVLTGIVATKGSRLLRDDIQAVLSQYDLSAMDWSMLAVLAAARNGVQHAYVAEELHVKAPFVTALAGPLLKRKLIRSVPSQFDARGKLLALSPDGKKLRRTVENALNRRLAQILSGVSLNELKAYDKLMRTVIANHTAPPDAMS